MPQRHSHADTVLQHAIEELTGNSHNMYSVYGRLRLYTPSDEKQSVRQGAFLCGLTDS